MCKNRKPVRRAAAALELALWLPFLGLMFVVALDYCRVFYASQTIQNCAWAGAMYASGTSLRDDYAATEADAAVQAALAEGVSLNPPLSAAQVSVSYDGSGAATVTVNYPFQMLSHWPMPGVSASTGTMMLTRSVKMSAAPKAVGS